MDKEFWCEREKILPETAALARGYSEAERRILAAAISAAWTHISMTYDGTTRRVFINGEPH